MPFWLCLEIFYYTLICQKLRTIYFIYLDAFHLIAKIISGWNQEIKLRLELLWLMFLIFFIICFSELKPQYEFECNDVNRNTHPELLQGIYNFCPNVFSKTLDFGMYINNFWAKNCVYITICKTQLKKMKMAVMTQKV